ncbi:hypothetical protein C8J57DRAFT_1224061 [Mycena rebaudengoi]|nr:hypothetical protein C8J57DRAFT_1224061 [Mycena rebaudengoi]
MGYLLGLGYDIGFKFGKQVQAHPVLGPLACANDFRSLVGSFHGHGHTCHCQLDNLTKYMEGLGREDLEGCKSFFSKSNTLAPSTCYTAVFHHQQSITTYLKHTDMFNTYQVLSLLITSKYCRALEVKQKSVLFKDEMQQPGLSMRAEFDGWLVAEKSYLKLLSKEPVEETLQMEYYKKLAMLEDTEEHMTIVLAITQPSLAADTSYADFPKATWRLETQRRHRPPDTHP